MGDLIAYDTTPWEAGKTGSGYQAVSPALAGVLAEAAVRAQGAHPDRYSQTLTAWAESC